ncbi:hypothetical protein QP028_07310 [Corynebacterium suedekumii]|nr:hypothetical protein QP028_07310 [Corynebacterium suedekumii]
MTVGTHILAELSRSILEIIQSLVYLGLMSCHKVPAAVLECDERGLRESFAARSMSEKFTSLSSLA